MSHTGLGHSANKAAGGQKPQTNVPIVVPASILVAMRASCTYLALDTNPLNMFNAHADYVRVDYKSPSGRRYEAALCSATLLKQWLRWLCNLDLFSGYIRTVPREDTAKGKASKAGEQRTRCVNVPTAADIERAAQGSVDSIRDWTFVAEVLNTTLVRPDDPALRLMQPKEVRTGGPYYADQVTSPNALCKSDRLQRLGYGRYALKDRETARRWEAFSLAESRRIAHATLESKGEPVSATVLKDLTEEQSDVYNSVTLSRLAASGIANPEHSSLALLGGKRLGSVVNPASYLVVEYNEASKRTKSGNKDKGTKERYVDMVDAIHRETGHRLNPDDERRAKTLEHRLETLRWMDRMRDRDPTIRFAWDTEHDDVIVRTSSVAPRAVTGQPSREPSPPRGNAHEGPAGIYQGGTASSRVVRTNKEIQGAMSRLADATVTYMPKAPSFTKMREETRDYDDGGMAAGDSTDEDEEPGDDGRATNDDGGWDL